TRLVWARGTFAHLGIAAAKPSRVIKCHTTRDRERALFGVTRLHACPKRSRRSVGVLVELARAIRAMKGGSTAPLCTQQLSLDRSSLIDRKRKAVVRVAPHQRSRAVRAVVMH